MPITLPVGPTRRAEMKTLAPAPDPRSRTLSPDEAQQLAWDSTTERGGDGVSWRLLRVCLPYICCRGGPYDRGLGVAGCVSAIVWGQGPPGRRRLLAAGCWVQRCVP